MDTIHKARAYLSTVTLASLPGSIGLAILGYMMEWREALAIGVAGAATALVMLAIAGIRAQPPDPPPPMSLPPGRN